MNQPASTITFESSTDGPDNLSHETAESSADEGLKLENQVCFPLYAASRLMMQMYKPHLDRLGLTYPQYLVMMVLWSQNALSVRQIGELLYLDSATLTQVLGNLEKSELITRERVKGDARTVINKLTAKGRALKKRARRIPQEMSCEFADRIDEVAALRPLLRNLVALLSDRIHKI
jgi:DNA-binding MarR family transcriptional regulator